MLMSSDKLVLILLALTFSHSRLADSFIPSNLLLDMVEGLSDSSEARKQVVYSSSLTHQEITRRGIVHSVVAYFHDIHMASKQDKSFNFKPDVFENRSQFDRYYHNLTLLFHDMTIVGEEERVFCRVGLDQVLYDEIEASVAQVDFDPVSKDQPHAHFDAETFDESNRRILKLTGEIDDAIVRRADLRRARALIGNVLHTIQDFYSHSNWVEMRHTSINSDIGHPTAFNEHHTFVDKTLNVTCNNECKLITTECNMLTQVAVYVLRSFMGNTVSHAHPSMLKCPLVYYVCGDNVVVLDQLVSGYYSTSQKLDDGRRVLKPETLYKCSHGGLFDEASYAIQARGGINKDSGSYLVSPHAHLHARAAQLAIQHTTHFINELRTRIGNQAFASLLGLNDNDYGAACEPGTQSSPNLKRD